MKSLLEEQKRMRELMGFAYEDNSHNVLSEEIINLSILNEQLSRKKNYQIMLQDLVNGKETQQYRLPGLGEKMGEILKGDITFNDEGKRYIVFKYKLEGGNYDLDDTTNKTKILNDLINNELVLIEVFKTDEDIMNDSNNSSAYDKHMEMMEREKEAQYYNEDDRAMYAPRLRGRNVKKGTVDLSAEVAEKRCAYFKTKGLNIPGITEKWADLILGTMAGSAGNTVRRNDVPEPDPKPTPTPPDPVNIDINFKLSDPFKYDSIILSDKGENQYQSFLENYQIIKKENSDKWGNYIEFLKSKSPIYLNAFSSKDGDPDKLIADSKSETTKTYESCRKSGGRTRESYDKCLSQARAKEMVRRLVEDIPELNGVFTPYGGGYKISSNSWTPNSTNHSNKNTIGDRYFEVAKWPSYNYTETPEPDNKEEEKEKEIELFDVFKHPQGLEPAGEWEIGKEMGIGNQVIPFWDAKNNKNILVLYDQLIDVFDTAGVDMNKKIYQYFGFGGGGLNGKYRFKVKVSDQGVIAENVIDGPLVFKGWSDKSDAQQDVTRGAQTNWYRAVRKTKDPFTEIGWINFMLKNNENRRGQAIT